MTEKPTTGDQLHKEVKEVLISARSRAYAAVNSAMLGAYWHIGRLIVERQGGEERSEYGASLIRELSKQLTAEFGKGFDKTNLSRMRQLYLMFPNVDTLCQQLSWSHYRLIIRVDDSKAREFYVSECAKSNWSVRQLGRQINTLFYERFLATRTESRKAVADEILTKEQGLTPTDIIKDPYVLEFLGLKHNQELFENDLGSALLSHIQKFLLELGRGFTFEARQKMISFDGRHFYIDLVFYNYRLKCFVLIDIKTGDLTHQDMGQMQMYVNYYTRELMEEGDNKPIGIILCADKSDTVVRYTLSEDNTQIFTSKYKTYIPSEEELRREIESERRSFEQEKYLNGRSE